MDTKSRNLELIELAKRASKAAHAPYSKFVVGAALVTTDGRTFAGCNVENASYGLTICAERVAVFKAVSEGCTSFSEIAIYTPTPAPTTPCGACRQVLREFSKNLIVSSGCEGGAVLVRTLDQLLPDSFGPEAL